MSFSAGPRPSKRKRCVPLATRWSAGTVGSRRNGDGHETLSGRGKFGTFAVAALLKTEKSMTDHDERNTETSEMRVMWIMAAVIVLFILGITGCNMLTHPDWMHGG